jgi:hypothetical protein
MIQYRILTLDNFDPKPYHCLFKDIPNQEMVSLDQVGEEAGYWPQLLIQAGFSPKP